jgi:LPXTG-motif cell wall-anchored protein
MGYDFLQATPEERIITIIVLVGLLAIAGILSLYDKRKNKK